MKTRRIGVIYPSDGVFDSEFIRFAPEETTVHITRWPWPDGDWSVPEAPDRMAELASDPKIAACAGLFDHIKPAVVTLGCTSVSFAGGDGPVLENIARGTRAKPSSTSTGFAAACAGLSIERVAIASVYHEAITRRFIEFLEHRDVKTVSYRSENWSRYPAGLGTDEVVDLAVGCDHPLAQALLIPETNILTSEAIPLIERKLGKPVLTAIQVTVWHAARRAGADGGGIGEVWNLRNVAATGPDADG